MFHSIKSFASREKEQIHNKKHVIKSVNEKKNPHESVT